MKKNFKKCSKCKKELIRIGAIEMCPHCYHVEINDKKWKGHEADCPKCGAKVKLFPTHDKGKAYHCNKCNTIGHVLNHEDFHKKVYKIPKKSLVGRKLAWLFDVPCKYWFRKDEVSKKICPGCDMKKVCDEHSKALYNFTKNKDTEIYLAGDFIEIVHK